MNHPHHVPPQNQQNVYLSAAPPKTQYHSNSPYKNYNSRPEMQSSQSAPPPAVYDTAPFYINNPHENMYDGANSDKMKTYIKYVPVPVYKTGEDNAAQTSEYNQYNHHEIEAQNAFNKRPLPTHQTSSYSSGNAMTPPMKAYRFEHPHPKEMLRNHQHNVQNVQTRPTPTKVEEQEYQTHYYYKPQELNTLEEYSHERPAHSYEVRETDNMDYNIGEEPQQTQHSHHVQHSDPSQNEYIRYVYEK